MAYGAATYESPYLAALKATTGGSVTIGGGGGGGGGSSSAVGYIDANDYANLATAVAAANPGQSVFLHPLTDYPITGSTLVLPVGVSLFSPSPYRGAYGAGGARVTGSVSPLIQFDTGAHFAGKQTIQGITFTSTASGTTAYIFLYNFAGYGLSWLRFYDCMFDMTSSAATNRVAIGYTWGASGTVEQVYYEHCGFNGCDTAIGGIDSTYVSDFDKCVIEKCRFDNCRGSVTWPYQLCFYHGYMRTGAVRDCVFEGATNAARGGILLGAQFQTYTIDNVYMEGMASAAASTYDEVVVADPPGAVTPGANLIVSGTRLGDRGTSTNAVRYSLNLEELGGSFRNLGTFTVTIASPAVFTKTSHGLSEGDRVLLTTSGALPTGLTNGGTYYVIPAGLTSDAFQVSATRGGAAINTTGSQSGTHTVQHFAPGAFVTASNMGTIRLSRYGGYSTDPSSSVEVHATNCVIS